MMQGEGPIPNSGDICVDFARQMVTHHWAAIVMAMDNVNLADWNEDITNIAKIVAKGQTEQLDQFISWLTEQGIPWKGEDFWTWVPNKGKYAAQWSKNIPNSDYSDYVSKMNSGMQGTTLIGELNLDFARQMIPHHWAAIQMAEDVLDYGCDHVITSIAEKVRSSQTRQIQKFKKWLKKVNWPWQGEDWTPNKKYMRGAI